MSNKIDELDRQIIAILQQDGRTSNVDIARQIGVTEATIRKRMDRLISQKIIRIIAVPGQVAEAVIAALGDSRRIIRVTAIPDRGQMGSPIETVIAVQLDMGNLEQIVAPLAALANVRSIKITTSKAGIFFIFRRRPSFMKLSRNGFE